MFSRFDKTRFSHQSRFRLPTNSFVGVLDAFSADLALAILPFRGFTSYTGHGWTVRDTDDNSEQEVLFDALGDPIAPTVVGNAAIKSWNDQSGNDVAVSQATSAAQPLWTGNILNGYPVARFDGTDDEIGGADSMSNDRTVYMVCKFRVGGGNKRAWSDTQDTGINAEVYDNAGTFYYYATAPNVVDPVGGASTILSLICLKYSSGTTCSPWCNNTPFASFGTTGYAEGSKGFMLASSLGTDFGDVDIAARLTYNTAHDDTTRQAIQTILADKFGITLA